MKTEVVAGPKCITGGAEEVTFWTGPIEGLEKGQEFSEPEYQTGTGRGLPYHDYFHLFISSEFSGMLKSQEDGPNIRRKTVAYSFSRRDHFNIRDLSIENF